MAIVLAAMIAVPVYAGNGDPAVDVTVLEDTPDRIVIQYQMGEFATTPVKIDGREYVQISLGTESLIKKRGEPAVPNVCRSVAIPGDREMRVKVTSSRFYDIADMAVAPDKGHIQRTRNPADVPYVFGKTYKSNAFYPHALVSQREPYIMRDIRGIVIELNPLQYNPVTRTLRVYTDVTLELVNVGPARVNVLEPQIRERKLNRSFHQIYRHHFVNYGSGPRYPGPRYAPLDENGDLLIICHDAWLTNVGPLVTHKNSIGIPTTAVGVSTIPGGNTSTAIKNYIQSVYDSSDLAFVLLVGDSAEVATPNASGGASDPTYSKVAGGDDYPDIMVGRFSAQSTGNVDTQVERTIEYEQMPAVEQTWFWKGTGIASSEGAGIGDEGQSDFVHMDEIRDWLLADGYTEVDRIYATTGGTSGDVTAAVNAGRGIMNYCGHGSRTTWVTTGFSNTHVNNLVNDNMLPFICSVACVNGEFAGYTCFAEAWLRATNSGEPTGAVGFYGSSINCSWAPPMEMQDEFNLLYTDPTEPYKTFGALCFAGSCSSIDDYGSSGVTIFNVFNVFGDPSLRVVGSPGPPHGMSVAPSQGLDSEGPTGGPFTPSSIVYTLENKNDSFSINYSVTSGEPWVSIDNPSGSLPPLNTTNVTVSINANANTLPNGSYPDTVNFINTTDHDGDTTRPVNLVVGVATAQYMWNMDTDPAWSTEGDWAWGVPAGTGGEYGGPDPSSGHTGNNVYGYNLSGDYTNSMPEYDLTTTAIDCEDMTEVSLKFWRWLNVEQSAYDHAYIRISTDQSNWDTIWQNGATIEDGAWSQYEFDISEYADNESTVYLRWTMGTTDTSWRYSGWNIDDVEIWAIGTQADPCAGIPADGDLVGGDGCNGNDIQAFVDGIFVPPAQEVACHGDFNGNKVLDVGDVAGMVDALLGL